MPEATTRTSVLWARFLGVGAAYLAAFLLIFAVAPSALDSAWFVVAAMICFLGLAAMARPIVRFRMPRPLREVRGWEVELYRALGAPAFGRFLRRTPARLLNRDVYFRPQGRDTDRVLAQLEAAETSHFWSAVLVLPYMARLAVGGEWESLFWVSLAQVAINLYPVMHLRLARRRVRRLTREK